MNLAEYSTQPKSNGNNGEFLKWTTNGEVKVLRFLYTSKDGADIAVVRKTWDDEQKKFVYNTPEGKLTCTLNAVLYEEGKAPRKVRWERSAAFTEQVCNGYWSKFPRIIDGVWEVTCTNPGTKEIKFSWFPKMGADFTTHPLPEGISIKDGVVVDESNGNGGSNSSNTSVDSENSPVTATSASPVNSHKTTKYWE